MQEINGSPFGQRWAHMSNLKAASPCFQRQRGFSNSKSRARRKEKEAWYVVLFGIEGPHTSMTVRTRFSSNLCGEGVFPQSEFTELAPAAAPQIPRVSSRVAKFAFRRISISFDQSDTIYSITSSDIPSFSAVNARSEAISYQSIQNANAAWVSCWREQSSASHQGTKQYSKHADTYWTPCARIMAHSSSQCHVTCQTVQSHTLCKPTPSTSVLRS